VEIFASGASTFLVLQKLQSAGGGAGEVPLEWFSCVIVQASGTAHPRECMRPDGQVSQLCGSRPRHGACGCNRRQEGRDRS
jgi:hypothetical protein